MRFVSFCQRFPPRPVCLKQGFKLIVWSSLLLSLTERPIPICKAYLNTIATPLKLWRDRLNLLCVLDLSGWDFNLILLVFYHYNRHNVSDNVLNSFQFFSFVAGNVTASPKKQDNFTDIYCWCWSFLEVKGWRLGKLEATFISTFQQDTAKCFNFRWFRWQYSTHGHVCLFSKLKLRIRDTIPFVKPVTTMDFNSMHKILIPLLSPIYSTLIIVFQHFILVTWSQVLKFQALSMSCFVYLF